MLMLESNSKILLLHDFFLDTPRPFSLCHELSTNISQEYFPSCSVILEEKQFE